MHGRQGRSGAESIFIFQEKELFLLKCRDRAKVPTERCKYSDVVTKAIKWKLLSTSYLLSEAGERLKESGVGSLGWQVLGVWKRFEVTAAAGEEERGQRVQKARGGE